MTPATRALGPGLRAAVWVQGCPFDCQGCIAPEWISDIPAHSMTPDEVAERLLADPEVDGLTFSGGEPMAQARGLARVAELARARRDLSLICFTGFRLERLARDPPDPGVPELLSQIDVLIDGRYVAALNDGTGLRGSTNQRVHHLTDRLRDVDLEHQPRRAEVTLSGRDLTIIGIPPRHVLTSLGVATGRAKEPS
ncbi:4Fe-4S single cluster domain-containing protein [Nonomuraea endophytica]|nr:4Fe-4S single cluster domain-containing protein [Nonomuraea endophytica]